MRRSSARPLGFEADAGTATVCVRALPDAGGRRPRAPPPRARRRVLGGRRRVPPEGSDGDSDPRPPGPQTGTPARRFSGSMPLGKRDSCGSVGTARLSISGPDPARLPWFRPQLARLGPTRLRRPGSLVPGRTACGLRCPSDTPSHAIASDPTKIAPSNAWASSAPYYAFGRTVVKQGPEDVGVVSVLTRSSGVQLPIRLGHGDQERGRQRCAMPTATAFGPPSAWRSTSPPGGRTPSRVSTRPGGPLAARFVAAADADA
jgi:hypothetical protein